MQFNPITTHQLTPLSSTSTVESAKSSSTQASVNVLGPGVTVLFSEHIQHSKNDKRSDFFKIGMIFAEGMRNADQARLTCLNTLINKRLKNIKSQTTGIWGWFNLLTKSGQKLIEEKRGLEGFVGAINEAQGRIKEGRQELENKVIDLASRAENIANTAKNLVDVFKLEVKPGQMVGQVVEELIHNFKESSEQEPPASKFRSKDVEEKDRFALLRLNDQFQGPESTAWREALYDSLSAKKDALDGISHICQPLQEAISKIKTQNDADHIAFYLMSEVCSIKGGLRIVGFDKLQLLLNHPRIKDFSMLRSAVLKAAKKVQLEAIRKNQSQIVWNILTNKQDRQAWDAEAEKLKDSLKHLDFGGIQKIAKKAKLKSFPSLNEFSKFKFIEGLTSLIADMDKMQTIK